MNFGRISLEVKAASNFATLGKSRNGIKSCWKYFSGLSDRTQLISDMGTDGDNAYIAVIFPKECRLIVRHVAETMAHHRTKTTNSEFFRMNSDVNFNFNHALLFARL
jgi:hypothetical protein